MATGITKRDIDIWHRKGNNWRKEGKRVKKGTRLNGNINGDYFYPTPDTRTKKAWIAFDTVVSPPPVEPPPPVVTGEYRIVWDDENPDYDYKSRTQQSGWSGPDNPPAVVRYYPEPREKSGDYRVRLGSPYDWHPVIVHANGGDEQKFSYLTGPARATYNQTGWDKQAYITMSGNVVEVIERVGEWYRIKTLKPSDMGAAYEMTIATHPQFVHRFTCVTWDRQNKKTKRINSTGTPRGDVFYFLVTNEGEAWIPARHIVNI